VVPGHNNWQIETAAIWPVSCTFFQVGVLHKPCQQKRYCRTWSQRTASWTAETGEHAAQAWNETAEVEFTGVCFACPCNQAHGRDNKASKTTSRTMLQRAPNTHTARSTACCLDSHRPQDDSSFIDTNSTLLLPIFQSPLYVDFGFLRRTSLYFHDLTLNVTRVTSIRHLWHLLIVTLPRIPYAHSVYVLSQQLLSKTYATQKTHTRCFNVCQEHIGNNKPIPGFFLVFYPPTTSSVSRPSWSTPPPRKPRTQGGLTWHNHSRSNLVPSNYSPHQEITLV